MEGVQKPQGSVVIIGAGTQGRRLAHMWSSRGGTVRLVDPQEKQLQDGLKYVEQLRADATNHEGNWGKIETSQPSSLQSTLKCVPENLDLKRKVITQLDELAPEDTIIASNSSSYGIFEIIDGMSLKNNKRIMSAHCYWPPETSAIEIMGHKDSDPKLIELVLEQCKEHGFSPFYVKKDSVGYIYNRIWAAIKRETLLTLSEGVATPKEIDAIFKDVLKTPKGPCEQMDVVGLDVVLDIENHYAESRSGIPTEPRDYLREMIQGGSLGVKNGRGFYDYEEQKK
ncbi:Fatty oxidation complex, alpha subunit FadB [Penicillium roqueforti FM164]|uniref:Fatty oxidation complex, alpha subunit FadB n=1 Tax=Penicillium roqueforti (strain FM164) TaxID=1365484 RepID=W6Q5X7_PENRF|nr:Fatty oxidation complex, alpha subunit FadB [Penicillium roqueforti FM164]